MGKCWRRRSSGSSRVCFYRTQIVDDPRSSFFTKIKRMDFKREAGLVIYIGKKVFRTACRVDYINTQKNSVRFFPWFMDWFKSVKKLMIHPTEKEEKGERKKKCFWICWHQRGNRAGTEPRIYIYFFFCYCWVYGWLLSTPDGNMYRACCFFFFVGEKLGKSIDDWSISHRKSRQEGKKNVAKVDKVRGRWGSPVIDTSRLISRHDRKRVRLSGSTQHQDLGLYPQWWNLILRGRFITSLSWLCELGIYYHLYFDF